jgi:Uma2 family endonuclease
MSTITSPPLAIRTLADMLHELGDIPPERIRFRPAPGTATEEDVVAITEKKTDALCELFDGVLVEKPVGRRESSLAFWLCHFLASYLEEHDIGFALGADGMTRVAPGQVRIPDAAFYAWDLFGKGGCPPDPIVIRAPSLAVEVLSPTNTKREMARKRREYFAGGCQVVWEVEPDTRQVRVYRSAEEFVTFEECETLDGGDVLPGFQLSIAKWFERALRNQK